MKLHNKFLLIISTVLWVSSTAHAGWSAYGTVTSLEVNSSPKRSYLIGFSVADVGCTNTIPVILLDPSTPQSYDAGKEMFATVLAAIMAGKQFRVYSSDCWQSYNTPIVNAIEVLP